MVHRRCIKAGGQRADLLVRWYLSWFTLARIIDVVKKIDKTAFESITKVHRDEFQFQEVHGLIRFLTGKVKSVYLKKATMIPMDVGLSWVPTWKAIPNQEDWVMSHNKEQSSIFNLLKYEIASSGCELCPS